MIWRQPGFQRYDINTTTLGRSKIMQRKDEHLPALHDKRTHFNELFC